MVWEQSVYKLYPLEIWMVKEFREHFVISSRVQILCMLNWFEFVVAFIGSYIVPLSTVCLFVSRCIIILYDDNDDDNIDDDDHALSCLTNPERQKHLEVCNCNKTLWF